MTPEEESALLAELTRLRERNRKLAEEKAYSQLILRLIERLDPLPGLEDMLRNMLVAIVECIGGTNIKVYYWMGEELRYQDFLGERRRLEAIDDPDVARVRETRAFVERRGSAEEALLMHGMLPGSWTWTIPLLVGQELVGIVKLENLHIHGATLGKYLPTFFSHAALILGSEIRNAAHRRAETELGVATERLRLATRAGLIGIWDWNIERDELNWDPSMYRLYGVAEGDFGGAYQAWIRALHPDDKAHADAEIQAALRGEREYGPEFRVVWPDGSIHHLQAASRTLRDASGKALRMVGINYDVTERLQAVRERLAHVHFLESMDRVNRAIQAAGDLDRMMGDVLDVVLSELGCDRAFLLYPCDPEAPCWTIPMERNRPQYPSGLAQGHEVPMDADVAATLGLLLAADGPVRFGPGTPNPLPAETAERYGFRCFMSVALRPKVGKPWQFGVHQCSRVRTWTAEEERLLQETGRRLADALTTFLVYRDLRESQQKLARAERIVHVGYWDRNLAAGRIDLSDEACRIFGLDPAERVADLQRWSAIWEKLIHADDRPRAIQAFARALEGGPRYDVEYRVIQPGGEVRFVHSQADITRDESGRPIRALGTMQDVTDRKRAEEEIRELNQTLEQRVVERTAELEAANRELEAFAYSVSHDLRAPLRAIDGYRGLLQRRIEGQLDEQGKRYLESISESANRMGQLIDDLLSFSRMGRVEMARTPVNLGELAREVIAELGPEAAGRSVEWSVGELPVVTGDRAMLRVVLVNLLANAIKFTRSRERAVIELGSRRGEDGEAAVFVRDNGVGFDMAYLGKLFNVFHRLHRADEFEGTGIGLANVRRIVARHRGKTWAEGKVGEGATFWFSLPAPG